MLLGRIIEHGGAGAQRQGAEGEDHTREELGGSPATLAHACVPGCAALRAAAEAGQRPAHPGELSVASHVSAARGRGLQHY